MARSPVRAEARPSASASSASASSASASSAGASIASASTAGAASAETASASTLAIVASQGLVYVTDEAPGLGRQRRGEKFIYRLPDGKPLRDAEQIDRIRRLAIPPAYTEVWICPLPHGHLQATGRDARGRKQYRYHADWRSARDADKFERMLAFGSGLPRIRARVKRDLIAATGTQLGRDAVLAAIVRLLDTTLVRVGNDEYARSNGSYGLTTLRSKHAALKGSLLRLRFRGKSGVQHEVALDDPRVARIVKRCQALPGQTLFHFQDDEGAVHPLGSADVNDYLREASGADFTAKDFRTWHGSVLAFDLWRHVPPDAPNTKRGANELLAEVAAKLGNTVAVCRKAYVHPRVLALLTGQGDSPAGIAAAARRAGLTAAEAEFMAFLKAAD